MTVTLKDMKKNLLSFDQAITHLEKTEPLSSAIIDSTTKTQVKLDPNWAEFTKDAGMTDLVPAFISVNGVEHQFTKEGILQATSLVGLRSAFALKNPVAFVEAPLNYWLNSGIGESAYKLVLVDGAASAFVSPTIVSFSNIELAESILNAVQEYQGKDVELLVDYKFTNSLVRTDVRFISPTSLHVMEGTNMADVPDGSPDVWSAGINLTNSLVGKSKTSIEAYLFRWWCTNGAIRANDAVGTWNRKSSGQVEAAVYEWAASAVDEVLGGMEAAFESVQALNNIKLKGGTADVLKKIFSDHSVPVTQQQSITEAMINSEELTMYAVMNAITQQANNPTLIPDRADKLMRIGGTLPEHYFDDTKAKIFSQGQSAGPAAPNPYLIKVGD